MKRLMAWVGPVSSAKSTGALGMAHRLTNRGMKVILIRPAQSKRDYESNEFCTKDGSPWSATFDIESTSQVDPILEHQKPDVVWFDEPALFPQELDPGLPPWLFPKVVQLREHYMILVSGIAATSELEVFGKSTPLLLATADEIIQCKGDCPWCGGINIATRSMYIGEGAKTTKDKVGGTETYQPACEPCWNRVICLDPSERHPL